MQLKITPHPIILGIFIVLSVNGCSPKPSQAQAGGFPTPEVGVVTVAAQALPMVSELPGRIDAIRTAEVRARVSGIILKKTFQEGADVNEDDVLFEIDPAFMQASYNSAQANLDKAQATFNQMNGKAQRYKSLVAVDAVSKQEYEDISAGLQLAKADVQAAKAAVDIAKLNLDHATVTAPISGHIGAAKVTEGTLVSQAEATQMALIQQLDPIYFDFTQSSTEVLKLRRSLGEGKLQSIAPGEAKVTLLLEDGTTYKLPGKLLFSDTTVDPTTGMVTLRAEFANPDHILLPGMYARGQLEQAMNADAIAVSQRGIAIGANGATAMVVTADNKVEVRGVKVAQAIGDKWIVTEGLKEGDRVIVEGLQKVKPGIEVKVVPFNG